MLNTIYGDYVRYKTYLTNGPYVKAQSQGEKLIREISLFQDYVAGALTGRSTFSDSAKTDFDALTGKTHDALTITLGYTPALKIDSLSFNNGLSWVNNIYNYPKDSILAWIGSGGTDSTTVINLILTNAINLDTLNAHLTIFRDSLNIIPDIKDSVLNWIGDSTLSSLQRIDTIRKYSINLDTLNSHLQIFRDSLTFVNSSQVANQIHDSIVGITNSQDSTWYSAKVIDTLTLGSSPTDFQLINKSGGAIAFRSQGNIRLNYNQNGILYGTPDGSTANGLELDFYYSPSSTIPNIVPAGNLDPNTGYSWVSSDKLGLVAGGVSTLTSEYNSSLSKSITKVTDSLYSSSGIKAPRIYGDSIQSNGAWNKNILSYGDVPSNDAVRIISSAGVQSFGTLTADVDSVYSGSLTDGAPTSAEITAIIGVSPSTAGSGARYLIADSDGTSLVYVIWSDGTYWHYIALTKAL